MTSLMQRASLAAFGAAAVTFGSMAPTYAFEFTRFEFTGVTDFADCNFFPEYQNANFSGFFTIRTDAHDLDDSHERGKYEISDFFIELTNPHHPGFAATIDAFPNGHPVTTKAFVLLSSFITPIRNGRVTNASQNNPTKADFELFFSDNFENPNVAPTFAPRPSTFVPSLSFLTLRGSETAPDLRIGIRTAEIRVAAIPEPTTMTGVGVFGLGLLLSKKKRKAA